MGAPSLSAGAYQDLINRVRKQENAMGKAVKKATQLGVPIEIARGIIEGNWDFWVSDLSSVKDEERLADLIAEEARKVYTRALSKPTPKRGNPYLERFPIPPKGWSTVPDDVVRGLAAIAKDLEAGDDVSEEKTRGMDKSQLTKAAKELLQKALEMENGYAAEWLNELLSELSSRPNP